MTKTIFLSFTRDLHFHTSALLHKFKHARVHMNIFIKKYNVLGHYIYPWDFRHKFSDRHLTFESATIRLGEHDDR